MIEKVYLSKKNIKDYKSLVGTEIIKQIEKDARFLKGKKIIHISSVSRGGGVAEILSNLIPLKRSLGIKASWFTFKAPKRFFEITKKIHNGFQGEKVNLNEKEKNFYLSINKKLANELKKIPADLFVIHDPQPLASILFFHKKPMIARIHLDLSTPDKEISTWIYPILKQYDKVVVSLKEFKPKNIANNKIFIMPPALDPLDYQHIPISEKKAREILSKFNINPNKPLIAQVSRFDPWKNPLGVIEAFNLAKEKMPELQLILLGLSLAKDDPQSEEVFEQVKNKTKDCSDVFLFYDPKEFENKKIDNDVFVNAVQCGSDLILQKSIKEGFGLTATEAMWKSKVVIAGTAIGLKLQIQNNKNGFIVKNPEQAAKLIIKLLKNPKIKEKIGYQAHLSVKKKYLITRLLSDYFKLYNEIIS